VALSPDVLVTALQKLMPGYTETFTTYHPLFDAIVKKGQKTKLGQPYLEFGLVPGGPGSITQLVNGSEQIQGGRRQEAVRGNTMATTMIYAYDVPGEDLRLANGAEDLLQLIKRYPERALLDFQDQLGIQLAIGNQADVGSFVTMNGDATYDPKGMGSRDGLFEFADKAAQTKTVHGVQANSVKGWHNQYGHITSFSNDGRRILRNAFYEAAAQGGTQMGVPDLLFADPGTYENYIQDIDDQILLNRADMAKGDTAPANMRAGVPFMQATMYREHEIISSAFSTPNAQLGVVYGINSGSFHLYTQGSDAKMETNGDFALRGPNRIVDQDAWRFEYVFSMGLYCDNRRINFAVTGGAQS